MNNPQLCRCGGVESIWHSFHYCLQNALKNTQTYTHSRAPARSAYITSEQSFCTYFYYGFTKRYSLLQLRCEEKKVNLISLKRSICKQKYWILLFALHNTICLWMECKSGEESWGWVYNFLSSCMKYEEICHE